MMICVACGGGGVVVSEVSVLCGAGGGLTVQADVTSISAEIAATMRSGASARCSGYRHGVERPGSQATLHGIALTVSLIGGQTANARPLWIGAARMTARPNRMVRWPPWKTSKRG